MDQKSKDVAYLLWFFLGVFGAHKFYLGQIGIGVVYLFAGGLFLIGWFIDLFTLSNQVDVYNALHRQGAATPPQNVIVNVSTPPTSQAPKASAEKQILDLAKQKPILSLKEVVTETSLDLEEAEMTLKKLVEKGIAKESVAADGKISYDFS